MMHIDSFSTIGLDQRRKLDHWNDYATDSFNPLVSDPADVRSFNGSIARTTLGDITVADVYSDAQVVRHSRAHVARTRNSMFFLQCATARWPKEPSASAAAAADSAQKSRRSMADPPDDSRSCPTVRVSRAAGSIYKENRVAHRRTPGRCINCRAALHIEPAFYAAPAVHAAGERPGRRDSGVATFHP